MKKFSSLFRLCGVALTVLTAGCTATPFAPIAVPQKTTVKPVAIAIDRRENTKELESLNKVSVPAYKIAPGDVFAITVPGRDDLNRPSITVMADGAVSVFPIGYVRLGGLTIEEGSALLSKKYARFVRNCEVILEPVTIQQATVTVIGAVATPGIKTVSAGVSRLTDVIASCGGLKSTTTEDNEPMNLADLQGAYILRNGRILPVDFVKVVNEGNWLHNIPVMNKDYIFIPSLENTRIIVLGEVSSPCSLVYQPQLTLLQAIAKTGGLKETNSRTIKVIRGGLKSPVVYNINIKDMQLGRSMDFMLEPRDIVFVPRDPVSEWNVMVRQIMPTFQLLNTMAGPFGNPVSALY